LRGHAVEARLYAEDPERGFLPSTGRLVGLRFPRDAGLRIDSGVAEGDAVTPFYDPMIAKVIAHAPTRAEALERLATALEYCIAEGIRINAGFLAEALRSEEMQAGLVDTPLLERLRTRGAAARRPA